MKHIKDPARAAALDILAGVLDGRRPLDDLLESETAFARLERRDRAFVRLLATTTLRRLGQIDRALGRFLDRPPPAKATRVRHILRLGACQLLFLGTPPHAAVSTALELAEGAGFPGFKGLINAVLRRVAEVAAEVVADPDAGRRATPDWLWDSWVRAYGAEAAGRIAQAHLGEPPLDLTPRGDPDALAARLPGARRLPTGSLRLTVSGPVTELPGFAEGAWWVQDAAAALPVRMLGAVDGLRVIDLCAAPGGKTAQLAAGGARVTAVDRSATRLRRVRDNLDRLGLDAELVAADATSWRPDGVVDAVLVDAPCSATGTIRRNPDIPWLKRPDDATALAASQTRILANALGMVRSGGVVVYCTCSLQPEEGEGVVAAALADGVGGRPETPADPALAPFLGVDAASGLPRLRTFPFDLGDQGGMDGFFAVLLRRH